MTTQQLQPTDDFTVRWNEWFEQSFDAYMSRHISDGNEALDDLAEDTKKAFDEFGKEIEDLVLELREAFGQERRTMSELVEVCRLLAGDNRYALGRIDQISRSFKGQRGIMQQKSVETTVIEEERTSRVSQVVKTIEEILAE